MQRFVRVIKSNAAPGAPQVPSTTKHNSARGNPDDCAVQRNFAGPVQGDADARRLDLADLALGGGGPPDDARQPSTHNVPQLVGDFDKMARPTGNSSDRCSSLADGNGDKVRRRHKLPSSKRKPRSASTSDAVVGAGLERRGKRRRAHSESGGGGPNAAFIDRWLAGKPGTYGHSKDKKRARKRKRSERKRLLIQGARGFKLEILKTVSTPTLVPDTEMFPQVRRRRVGTKPTEPKSVDFNADQITSIVVRATVKWLGRILGAIRTASQRSAPGPLDLVVSDDRALLHYDAMRRQQCAFEQRPAFKALKNPACLFPDHVYAALPLLFDDPRIIPLGRNDPIRCRLMLFMEVFGQVQARERRRTTLLKIPSYDLCGPRALDSRKRMRQNHALRQFRAQWHRL